MFAVRTKKLKFFDYLGIALSVMCAIHCALGPLLLLLPAFLGSFFQSESFHLITFLLIVPIAGFTFFRCYLLHGDKNVLILGSLALVALTAGLLADFFAEDLETPLTVVGSFLIISAHLLNIRNCSCLKNPGHGHCCHLVEEERKKAS